MALMLHAAPYRYKPDLKVITVGEKGRGRSEDYVFVGKSLQESLKELREARKNLTVLCELTKTDKTKILSGLTNQNVEGVLFTTDWHGGFRGGIDCKLPEEVEIILRGYVAQGEAGRMGGWEEYMLLTRKPVEIFYRVKGRTYGSQPERVIKVTLEPPFVEYYELDEFERKKNSQLLDNY